MVVLLVVIAALFVWRACSKVSNCKNNDGFIIDGDSVDTVSKESDSNEADSEEATSKFQYKYYGLFLAD